MLSCKKENKNQRKPWPPWLKYEVLKLFPKKYILFPNKCCQIFDFFVFTLNPKLLDQFHGNRVMISPSGNHKRVKFGKRYSQDIRNNKITKNLIWQIKYLISPKLRDKKHMFTYSFFFFILTYCSKQYLKVLGKTYTLYIHDTLNK